MKKPHNNTCQLTFWPAFLFVYGFAMVHKTPHQPKCSCTLRYASKPMKSIILLIIPLLLAGCPAVMNGLVQNRSDEPIVIYWQGNHSGSYKVPSSSNKEMFWLRGCITVVENEALHHFDGSEIPEDLVNIHIFSTSVELLYRKNQLSYVTSSGKKVDMPKVASCENA